MTESQNADAVSDACDAAQTLKVPIQRGLEQRLLHGPFGQAEPLLDKVNPQHGLHGCDHRVPIDASQAGHTESGAQQRQRERDGRGQRRGLGFENRHRGSDHQGWGQQLEGV